MISSFLSHCTAFLSETVRPASALTCRHRSYQSTAYRQLLYNRLIRSISIIVDRQYILQSHLIQLCQISIPLFLNAAVYYPVCILCGRIVIDICRKTCQCGKLLCCITYNRECNIGSIFGIGASFTPSPWLSGRITFSWNSSVIYFGPKSLME